MPRNRLRRRIEKEATVMFKVIVAGGREFNDYALLRMKLDQALRNRKMTRF